MFYSSQLLSRKTPLGICWLASHSESKRLKRTQIFEFSISQSCDSIINPEAPLALRLSGQLLLGVVRIYQRKLAFLETDAKNAIDGLQRKEAATQNVDLPDGGVLPENAITLPGSDPTLFGASGDLFPSFNMASTPGLDTGRSGSIGRISRDNDYTMADDISDVFGSTRWTGSEDRFDMGGSLEQFSTELERLRDAADLDNTAGNPVFFDQGDDFGPMDDIMEAPGAELFDAPSMLVDPGKTPGSVGHFSDLLKAGSGGGISPMGDLPDVEGPIFDGGDDFGGYDYDPLPPSTPMGKSTKKKKTFHLDVDTNGDPATLLDEDEAKRLLRNRATLMKKRGAASDAAIDAIMGEKDEVNRLASIVHIAPDISAMINPIIMPPKVVKEKKKIENNDPVVSPFMTDGPGDDNMNFYDGGGMDDYGDAGYDDAGFDDLDEMHTPAPDVDVEKAILTRDGFTARTEAVLKQIKSRAEPSPGDKRAHEASSSTKRVSLHSIVQGKSRLEACRWFFESLVLRNKGHVDLEQATPYGDISIVISEL